MARCFFVYAGDLDNLSNRSPYTITKHLYSFLTERVEVSYHKWDASYDLDLTDADVLLGHPHYSHDTIVQRVFRNNQKARARCLIHPLHTRRQEDNMPFDFMAREADAIFSICGPYWYNTILDTPFAHWRPKIIRLDMAIDLNLWPRRKTTFRPPGQRRIVYVGSAMPQKNLSLMTYIAGALPQVQFQWFGGSGDHQLAKLPNVEVEGWIDFPPEKVQRICDDNDIFLSTSISDANPTTILEFGLASGLPVVATQTSGWQADCITSMPVENPAACLATVRQVLNEPSDWLEERSKAGRALAERDCTWDRFCNLVWDRIEGYFR